MKNLYHRILSLLNLNGRDWVFFLLTLLLAFSIWLIHNLSLKYSDYLHVQIEAHCEIPGHSSVSIDKAELVARCNASGYKILKSHFNRDDMIRVGFRPAEMKHIEGDLFYVTSSDLTGHFNSIFGSDVIVEDLLSDTLFFRFPYENHKKVPIHPVTTFSFKDQYVTDGGLHLNPDSIIVYGEPFQLEAVTEVYTKPIRAYEISENISGVIELENQKGLRMAETAIHYSMNVKRFVEISCPVKVKAQNVPEGKTLHLYPSEVEVTLKCNFPLLDDPSRTLMVEIDYNEFTQSLSGMAKLKADGIARGVISYEINPPYVSCFVGEEL